MSENHIIPLPEHFRYLSQFPGGRTSSAPSPDRSLSAALAMLAQIAAPGRWIPEEVEKDIYDRVTAASRPLDGALAWLREQNLPFVDLFANHGLDATTIDPEYLRQTLERMNAMNIPQLLVVADESALHTIDGRTLHSWIDNQQHLPGSHALARVGYAVGNGGGLYFDPAAPGFEQPLPISWKEAIVPGSIVACLAIMPAGVAQPPTDHDWLTQDWPPVVPQPDWTAVQKAIATAQAEMDAHDAEMDAHNAAVKFSLAAVLAEASKGGQQ